MVFCFLPGTRPASVMFCMMSACCFNWQIMWVWFDIVQYCLSAHFHWNASVFDLFGFSLCLEHLCRVLSACCPTSVLCCACIMLYVVILCTDILRENMSCLLFQLQYLPPPWGDCKSTPIDSEYFSTYSITACRIDCETRYLLENCNCRMVHMPGMASARPDQIENAACTIFCYTSNCLHFISFGTGTSTVCTPEQYKDCADPALGKPTHLTAEVLNVMESPRILHWCLNVKVFNQRQSHETIPPLI